MNDWNDLGVPVKAVKSYLAVFCRSSRQFNRTACSCSSSQSLFAMASLTAFTTVCLLLLAVATQPVLGSRQQPGSDAANVQRHKKHKNPYSAPDGMFIQVCLFLENTSTALGRRGVLQRRRRHGRPNKGAEPGRRSVAPRAASCAEHARCRTNHTHLPPSSPHLLLLHYRNVPPSNCPAPASILASVP